MSTHGSSLPHVRPERTGGTRFVTSATLRRAECGELLERIYDLHRRAQPGAPSRPPCRRAPRAGQPPVSAASRYVAVHRDARAPPDGHASYALESGTLTVDGTIAVVTAHRPDAAARADALFRGERAPHCLHWF
ncbi:hypothetical protein [Streptomyces sp. NPDC014746]|uniref:hypothetical protein n=1 Tax=Streptomyces sp. NPDC014746 TaxID=3364904 RepID=UPI0036FF36F0